MISKSFLVFCFTILLIQTVLGQCGNFNYANNNLGRNAGPNNYLGTNFGFNQPSSGGQTSGGSFTVLSGSPIAPSGLAVAADNLVLDGSLAVNGNMPFAGAVGVEGNLPAGGQGAVAYTCGNEVGLNTAGPGAGLSAGLTGLTINSPLNSNIASSNAIGAGVGGFGLRRPCAA